MDRQEVKFEKYKDGSLKQVTVTNQIDLLPAYQSNYDSRKEMPKGFTPHSNAHGQLIAKDVPIALVLNDPDGKEWWQTRSKDALAKFLAKYPLLCAVENYRR